MKIGQLLSVKAIGIIGAISALTLGTALFILTLAPPTHADDTPSTPTHLTLAESTGKVFCILDVGADLATPYTSGYDCDKDGSADDMRFVITKTPGPSPNTTLVMAMDAWSQSAWTTITDSNTNPDAISTENINFFTALPTDLSATISKTAAFPSQTWALNSLSINGYDVTEAPTGITTTGNAAPISYVEWMGSAKMYNTAPIQNSVGDLFCKALTNGTSCYPTSSFYTKYGPVWTRTTRGTTGQAWTINGRNSDTMISDFTNEPFTVLPVMAATSDLEFCDITPGTFDQPYFIAPNCPEAPTLTLGALADNPWVGHSLNATGTISDPQYTTGFTKYFTVATSTTAPTASNWGSPSSDTTSTFQISRSLVEDPNTPQHYLHYKIVNPLGITTTGYFPFRIDAYGPEIEVTPSGSTDEILPAPVTPLITASDARTGLAALCYSWDAYIDKSDCDDPGLTIITSGTVLDTNPLNYGTTHTLHIYAFDRLGTRSTISETYIIAKRPPVITSISPTSGPTTGGTELTITGANFDEKFLDNDEIIIESVFREDRSSRTACTLYQLTNKNRILATDCAGNTSIVVDSNSVTGNIYKLGDPQLESPFDFLYFLTDHFSIHLILIDENNDTEAITLFSEEFESGEIYYPEISFGGGYPWSGLGAGYMPILVAGDFLLGGVYYDSTEDEYAFGGSSSTAAECTLISIAGQFGLCEDRTTLLDVITDNVLKMPAGVTINSITPASLRFNENIIAQIIGSDNKIYFATASFDGRELDSDLLSASDFFVVAEDYRSLVGTLTSITCADDRSCFLLDDLGNIYLLDSTYGLVDYSDLIDYAPIKSSITSLSISPIGLIAKTTENDYYLINDDPSAVFQISEQKTPRISLGGSTCAITSWTDTSITCTTSAHAHGTVDVALYRNGATTTLPQSFTYIGEDPILSKTLTDDSSGIIIEHLGSGFTSDLYLSVNTVDPATRDLGAYSSFHTLGIYDIEICSTTTATCEPIHTWPEGLKIKIPLSDTSYDRYHILYLPTPDLAHLIESTREGNYAVFSSTHLSEYAVVAMRNSTTPPTDPDPSDPSTPPTVPDTGAEFLGIPLTPATTGGFVISLIAGAGVALWFTRRKWGKK